MALWKILKKWKILICQEKQEEKCVYFKLKEVQPATNSWLRGVTTHRGTCTLTQKMSARNQGGRKGPAGTNTTETPSEPSLKDPQLLNQRNPWRGKYFRKSRIRRV